MAERDFSLWIGDVSADVDDYQLYKTFASRYMSVKAAKGNQTLDVPFISFTVSRLNYTKEKI